MRILVDENIPRTTVDRLREFGHDVKDIRGTDDEGMADAGLWEVAVRERRLLITTDKGFTEYRVAMSFAVMSPRSPVQPRPTP
ncbi:MAG: DUF5615 family PIN-like protein [Bryobacterales bacterium]|nr:DUF5615 family PIN-like protein [Bryobacterales bacterium]